MQQFKKKIKNKNETFRGNESKRMKKIKYLNIDKLLTKLQNVKVRVIPTVSVC